MNSAQEGQRGQQGVEVHEKLCNHCKDFGFYLHELEKL